MKKKEFIQELKKHQKLSKGQKGIHALNNNIIIKAIDSESCELRSTDLNIMMTTTCKNIQEVIFMPTFSEVLINPDLLIKYLSKQGCCLKIEDNQVVLDNRIKLNYIDPNYFPIFPEFDGLGNHLQVDLDSMKRLVNYCGNDVTNPMYSGINFQNDEEENDIMATTDSKIIACLRDEISHCLVSNIDDDNSPRYNFTISKNIVKYLDNKNVIIDFANKRVRIKDGNTEILANMYEGKYPVYKVVYKKMHKNTYSMKLSDIEAFLSLVDNDCTILVFDFSRIDTVVLEYISKIDYSRITQECPCQIAHNDLDRELVGKIGLNPKYLKKYIKASMSKTCENFVMKIGSATEPVHFSYDNVVLMPLRLED